MALWTGVPGQGNLGVDVGSVGGPAYGFAADSNLGWYRIGPDIIGLAVNGVEVLRVSSGGTIALTNGQFGNLPIKGPRPWADVRAPEYGATGVGAYDLAAFVAARDALGGPGIIFVPNGTYGFGSGASGLTLLNDQILLGESTEGVTIRYTGTGAAIVTSAGARRGRMEQFTLDGLSSINSGIIGIHLDRASYWHLQHVRVVNFTGVGSDRGNAIRITPNATDGYFNLLENVHANASGIGIRLATSGGQQANANTLLNVEAISNADDGLKAEGSTMAGLTVIGGQYSFNGGDGIEIDGRDHKILSCWLEDNTGAGIRNLSGSPGASIWAPVAAGNVAGNLVGVVPGIVLLQSTGVGVGGLAIGTPDTVLRQHLTGTTGWDPGSIADGAVAVTNLTVSGAAVGDIAYAAHTQVGANDVMLSAHVQGTDTVRVVLMNKTGGALDVASGTLRVNVWRY